MHVQLLVRGSTVLITPWCPSVLKSALTATRRKKRVPFERGKPAYIYEKTPLYQAQGKKTAYTHAGLLPRICRKLQRTKGYTYELIDQREPLDIPDLSLIDVKLRTFQPQVLAAICTARFGIIDCATGFGKTFIIQQLCKIFPGLRILVVSGSIPVVRSIYERVCRTCPDRKVCRHSSKNVFHPESDVCVSTVGVLHKIPPDWPDLLLYDEAHEAGSPTALAALTPFAECRRFGLSASPKGRSDGGDRFVEALFGPVIVKYTYQESQEAGLVVPIECWFLRLDKAAKIDVQGDIARKRQGYWRNYQRNNKLALAAREFDEDTQVLIFVEKTEHALRLKLRLPEFEVVHSGVSEGQWCAFVGNGLVQPEDLHLKKPNSEDIQHRFESAECRKVICTTCWNKGVDFPHLRVLIRGDGQSSEIPCTQIVGRLARIMPGKEKGILIDCDDRFDSWYQDRADQRRAQYVSKGWTIIEWDP